MKVYISSVVTNVFELSNYLDDIMAYLKEDQCKDSKFVICFALMVVRRKKKR